MIRFETVFKEGKYVAVVTEKLPRQEEVLIDAIVRHSLEGAIHAVKQAYPTAKEKKLK
ncbi:hypothetical protein Gekk315_00081 [Aeromonas phage Gekk3-15]